MIKEKRNTLISTVCLLLPLFLTACSTPDPDPSCENSQSTEQQSEYTGNTEKEEKDSETAHSLFGSAPWFRDDTGSRTQIADDWIYGYWGRQLCRVNMDTLEAEVLYEAVSPQDGCFCIWDGSIYFLEKRMVDYLDGAKGNLRRIKCDGSDLVLLAEDIPVQEYQSYEMNFYNDILYLTCPYGDMKEDLFFRISKEDTADPVDISETLYGLLPEGYTDACRTYKYSSIPNIASCMTHFGYAFVTDMAGKLYRLCTGQ